MAYVLFEKGKKIGTISDWIFQESAPVFKEFLGKTVLSNTPNKVCTFTSPKPIRRGNAFIVIADGKTEFSLDVTQVVGGTFVTATVLEKKTRI